MNNKDSVQRIDYYNFNRKRGLSPKIIRGSFYVTKREHNRNPLRKQERRI